MSTRNSPEEPTPLEAILKRMIELDGPIPVDRYMDLCLSHPDAGYYTTRDPFGPAGDFVTAPEISQIFGELIGLWCAQVWTTMGTPRFNLVELGPGRGTLMDDMLRAAGKLPGFTEAASIVLVETSPALRRRQSATLAARADTIQWFDRFDEVPDGPAIVVANEFLDALPVRQFERTEEGWCERMVGAADDGSLKLGLMPSPVPEALLPPHAAGAIPGSIIEISPAVAAVTANVATRLVTSCGAALFIDYGHGRSGIGETLQAVRAHRYADILERPGECDLTAHVDFASVSQTASDRGAAVHGPVTQGDFLDSLGIRTRAEILKAGAPLDRQASIDGDVRRLTAPDEMGEMFKVLALTSSDLPPPPGVA